MVVIWRYFRVGHVERFVKSKRAYEWRDGYARWTKHGFEQPWVTKREARTNARRNRAKAVFYATGEEPPDE